MKFQFFILKLHNVNMVGEHPITYKINVFFLRHLEKAQAAFTLKT